jgi:hypothetical protein
MLLLQNAIWAMFAVPLVSNDEQGTLVALETS